MAAKSKRKAREAALRALYEVEVGGTEVDAAVGDAKEAFNLSPDLATYSERMVRETLAHLEELDSELGELIHDYDFSRLAAVDRNVLRLAAYELRHEPSIPAAVSIDEAIEISRKFSTVESGKFVNGVLGKYLERYPKTYVQAEEEMPGEPEEPEIIAEVVTEDSPEAVAGRKFGTWTVRSE